LIRINNFPTESTSSDGFERETFEKMCKFTKKISYLNIWEHYGYSYFSSMSRIHNINKKCPASLFPHLPLSRQDRDAFSHHSLDDCFGDSMR